MAKAGSGKRKMQAVQKKRNKSTNKFLKKLTKIIK